MEPSHESSIRDGIATCIGYPCNLAYDYTAVSRTTGINLNNVGCPYGSSSYRANTKDLEVGVLKYFAELWEVENHSRIWGYLTSGGTEANMQGLYVGREVLGDPVLYASADSHYSIFKIAKLLKLDLCVVRSQANGEMDYVDFERRVRQRTDRPALVNANLGTTMKGAVDRPEAICRILRDCGIDETRSYVHADGALMGFVLPFLERDLRFTKRHINSMSISGHKFLGVPFPCGVFLMERRFVDTISSKVEYIGANDCMITGSRSGHSTVFLHHILTTKSKADFRKDVEGCVERARYLTTMIPGSWRNANSITVVLPKPKSAALIEKWQLAVQGDIAHIVVMPHVTRDKIDDFLVEYFMCLESSG